MSIASKKSLQPLMYVLAYWPTLRSGSITNFFFKCKTKYEEYREYFMCLGFGGQT